MTSNMLQIRGSLYDRVVHAAHLVPAAGFVVAAAQTVFAGTAKRITIIAEKRRDIARNFLAAFDATKKDESFTLSEALYGRVLLSSGRSHW